jgi:hypothetical protein
MTVKAHSRIPHGVPTKRHPILRTPRIAHVFAVMVMLLVAASVRVTPDAPVNPHTPRGPYDHIVLDSIDAGLAAVLPAPLYRVTQQVMQVLVQPADAVNAARKGVGLDTQATHGSQLAEHAGSFLDGVLFLALIGGSVVGVMVRILVKVLRD